MSNEHITDEQIRDALEAEFLGEPGKRNLADDLRVARATLALRPAAQPVGEPMTEEQVDAKCLTIQGHLLSRRDRDRAVWRLSEAHHGILPKTQDK